MIRYLKLTNGEDIVAKVADTEESGFMFVSDPMQVLSYFEDGEKILSLSPWLPRSSWSFHPIFNSHLITISGISKELEELYNECVEEFDILSSEEYNSSKEESLATNTKLMKHPKMNEESYKKLLEAWQPSGNTDNFMH